MSELSEIDGEDASDKPKMEKECLESLVVSSSRLLEKAKSLAIKTYSDFPLKFDVLSNYFVYMGVISAISSALQRAIKHHRLAKVLLIKIIEDKEFEKSERFRKRVIAESKRSYLMSSIVSFIPACIEKLAFNASYVEYSQINLAKFISQHIKDDILTFIKRSNAESYNKEVRKVVRCIKSNAEIIIRLAVVDTGDSNKTNKDNLTTILTTNPIHETAGDKEGMTDAVIGKVGMWTSRSIAGVSWADTFRERTKYLSDIAIPSEYSFSLSATSMSRDNLPGLVGVMTEGIVALKTSELSLMNKDEGKEDDLSLHVFQELLSMAESRVEDTEVQLNEGIGELAQEYINIKKELSDRLKIELERLIVKEKELEITAQSLIGRTVTVADDENETSEIRTAMQQLMVHRHEIQAVVWRINHTGKILEILKHIQKTVESI